MRNVILVAALALAGCASVPMQEQDAATEATFACYVRQAQMLDDHTSDAATIGRVVASACGQELEREIALRGHSFVLLTDDYDRFAQGIRNGAPMDATQVVLSTRRGSGFSR